MSISNLENPNGQNTRNLFCNYLHCNGLITGNILAAPGSLYTTNLTGMIPVTALPYQINLINNICYFKSAASFFGAGGNSNSGAFSVAIDIPYRPSVQRKVLSLITAGTGSSGTVLYPIWITINTNGSVVLASIDGTNASSGTNYYFPGLEFSYSL